MCLYAMNETFALLKFDKASQKNKKPNYYGACNDLLKINASPNGLVKFYDKIIKWISNYGCNVFFTEQEDEKDLEFEERYAFCADLYSSVHFGESKQEMQDIIRKKLKSKKIAYIDSDFKPIRGSYVFDIFELKRNIEIIRTVLELYSFIQGEPMIVPPCAQNGKPLLSNKLIGACRSFYPLSKFSSKIKKSFVLEPTYKDEVNSLTSAINEFEVFDSDERYEGFKMYCDNTDSNSKKEFLQRWKQTILTPSMIEGYPLNKLDKYGDVYLELARETICAYLDMYSSLDNYFSQANSLYELNDDTGQFKKKSPATINEEKEKQLWGYIELHSALARSILRSRMLKCKYCHHYFIAKRSDAKTCGDYCRNHLNGDDES